MSKVENKKLPFQTKKEYLLQDIKLDVAKYYFSISNK